VDHRLIGRRYVAWAGFLRLEREHFEGPEGRPFERLVVRHPGAVAVVPLDGDSVFLVRQFRTPVGRSLLEIPAGKLDVAGETLEVTARRECEEEIGLSPGRISHLRTILTTPGFSDERIDLFLAEDLSPVPARPDGIEEEHAEVVRMSFAEIEEAMGRGEIVDAKTLIGLYDVLSRRSAS
jgi:ADP-ribose pyrophosphatase